MSKLRRLIRQKRIMVPLTLQELADRSGISASHIGRVERGERSPSAGFLKKIAGPLHFEVGELLTLAGYLPPLSEYEDEMQPESSSNALDPYVSWVLSKEPVDVQRAVISILVVAKSTYKTKSLN